MAGRGDDSPPSCGDTAVLISNGGPSKGDGTEQEERCDNDRSAGRGTGYHKEAEAKRRRTFLLLVAVTAVLLVCCILLTVLLLLLSSYGKLWSTSEDQGTNSTTKTTAATTKAPAIGGLYILERLGDDFPGYLESLKIPRQAARIVLEAGEVMEITQPRRNEEDEEWRIVVKTDYGEHMLRFRLGVPFVIYSNHGTDSSSGHRDGVQYLCTMPSESELRCVATERGNGKEGGLRTLVSEMRFGDEGMVETKTHVETGARGTKHFIRVKQEEEEGKEDMTPEYLLGEGDEGSGSHEGDDEDYEYLDEYFEEIWE